MRVRMIAVPLVLLAASVAQAGVVRAGFKATKYTAKESYKVSKPVVKTAVFPVEHPVKSSKAVVKFLF